MNRENRIAAFCALGTFMSQFGAKEPLRNNQVRNNDVFFDGMKHQLKLAYENNGWFTPENMAYAFRSWSELLTKENLDNWLNKYHVQETTDPKKIAVIMAGNIPLVGFHDFLSVLITGHSILIKQASKDKHLLPYLVQYLFQVEPAFKEMIEFADGQLSGYDAVIATGSNNTSRYFEYYFKDKPSIIRHNRNSVALISGKETEDQLKNLGDDIFRYFGLGCRSVSKIFFPTGFNFDVFFNAVYPWHDIINYSKYANNYDYNKAVYLMSEFDMLDNGFLMIKEDSSYASPIATLFYEYYNNPSELKKRLKDEKDMIQCIVASGMVDGEVEFGQTQMPRLTDYADDVDTVDFLLKI
ncbi:MAG: acyl-CoA reductase [Bacteroidia bacterium]|nr:acyl-CoA reductase [Bacteroidia bacterium]NNL79742.1 acyl-CoA reductase [Flavobacteriaceae bacterium]